MNAAELAGFPRIGATLPRWAITAALVVAGLVAAALAVGQSGWLVFSVLLIVAAAAFPRTPFAAGLIVQVAVAEALASSSTGGYGWRLAIVLLALHLVQATSVLTAWLPKRVRVQPGVLRRPLVRFLVVQAAVQVAAFVVLGLLSGRFAGSVWLGLTGGVAAAALAVLVLGPLLREPAVER